MQGMWDNICGMQEKHRKGRSKRCKTEYLIGKTIYQCIILMKKRIVMLPL